MWTRWSRKWLGKHRLSPHARCNPPGNTSSITVIPTRCGGSKTIHVCSRDAPLLTVVTEADGTGGFSIGLEQLIRHRALWLPDHDVFVTLADSTVDFAAHLASLEGERVLDRVKREPESTLADWTSKWEDVGNPDEWNQPWEVWWLGTRGHLVGTVARHGSLYKFGIDRWGSIRPDYASPHRFRLDPLWPGCQWKGQRIVEGLPVVVTELEQDGQHCDFEQFAAVLPYDRKRRRRLGD
jgi:hypothetical protein